MDCIVCGCFACAWGDGCFAWGDGCFAWGDGCFACGEADLLLEFELLKDVGLYVVLPELISSNNLLNASGLSENSSGIQNPSFFLLTPLLFNSVAQTVIPSSLWCFDL